MGNLQNKMVAKLQSLERNCFYGLTHFCDGTPNKSVDEHAKTKPTCPNYYDCYLRRQSLFDRGEPDA